MDKVTETGKKIGKVQKTSNLNVRRAKENFVQPERIVNSFNKLHRFRTEFVTTPGYSARLNLKITEFPVPCTINPPLIHISTNSNFNGDNPGYVTELFDTTSNLVPPDPDFIFTGGGIQVPLDGCYSVMWTSASWGVGYYWNKHVTVALTRNGYEFRTVVQGTTGVIITLGPGIYVYTPASPIYAVVDCLAGDIISAYMTQEDISETYPWYNGGLSGFFHNPLNGGHIFVELVAEAEGLTDEV